jgi:GH15 family glucan-1,4-alpha-glucosidase
MNAVNPTPSSATSTTSLYLSNWQDMVGIWKAAKLCQLDSGRAGPRLGELHYLRGSLAHREVNQIVDYCGFFRDESRNITYTHVGNFDSEAWFESGAENAGMLTTNYLTYHGAAQQPRLGLSRCFAGPPNQPFFIVRYTLTNSTAEGITFNVLDQVHLHNLDFSKNVHAWYDAAQNAFIADMTASGQLFMVFGALQPVDGYQAANDRDSPTADAAVSGWRSFDANGTLQNNADVRTGDVSLAFNKRVVVAAGASSSIYFYLGVCETQAEANAAIAAARASTGDAWLAATAAAYNGWLTNGNQGRRVHFADDALNKMFDRALIVIKNVQNPVVGTFAATTNPFAYEYKNWVRDASTTSIALDASGHHAEAEMYWRWMAGSQGSDGTWKTTYNTWNGNYVPFVEPEYDSIGAFMYGVYRHYTLTADTKFLRDLWPSVRRAADWILSNIQPNGFGQADYSIWEEGNNLEHNSYTQSWYVIGCYAAQALAEVLGDTPLAEWYAGGAASILTALQRPSNWKPPGAWNPLGYYNRAVNANGTARPLVDSSSNMLIALGVIDHESGRAASHVDKILSTLTHENYGLARYPGDNFYYTGAWSPGGNEALASEPSWPQMSLWVAVYDILRGQRGLALPRMQWCASIFGKGYMPPGEAVSNVTRQPLPSSMSEPLTASAFILTALMYEEQYSLSVIPPIYNAGAAKTIGVSFGAGGDWRQWTDVPYFVGPQSASGSSPMCTIKRVYITNDYTNIYVRVDNVSGAFSPYQQQPSFSLHVYGQDLAGGNPANSSLGIYGQPLNRPMSYMVERRSDTSNYQRWRVDNGEWVVDRAIGSVIAPQWDPATGRLEAVIPISAMASGYASMGNWADILIVLVSYDAARNVWHDGDRMLLHYRLSVPGQSWIYGNIEQ